MRESEALEVVATVRELFPREPWSRRRTAAWVLMLADLDLEAALAAVTRVVATSPHVVAPADVRREYADAAVGAVTGGEAWAMVLAEVRRVGHRSAPRFADSRVAAAVQAVGWDQICRSDRIGVERAHFGRAYDALVERARRDVQVPQGAQTPEQRVRLGSPSHSAVAGVPLRALLEGLNEPEGDE